jgi:ABC-type glycerol-3-phosphate transport system substrate-binding protein
MKIIRNKSKMAISNPFRLKATKWIAALAGVTILSSCSPTSLVANDDAAIPDAVTTTIQDSLSGPVDLDFWHVYTGDEGETLDSILSGFEAAYPGINVTSTFVGGYGQLTQKTMSAIRAGNEPNVVITYESDALEYLRSDAIVDLAPYREDSQHGLDAASWNDILEVERLRNTFSSLGGANLSMPWTVASLMLGYNVDTLEKLGYSDAPRTWTEFKEICSAAMDQLGQKCFPISTDASTFSAVAMSFGGHAFNSDGTASAFDSSAWTSALQLYSDLAEAGHAFSTTVGSGDTSTSDLAAFASGSSPFIMRTSRLIRFIDTSVGDAFTWNAAALPQGKLTDTPTTVLFGPNLSVLKSTPDEQLASWLLVKYLMSSDAQLIWSSGTGNQPIRTSTTELPEYSKELAASQKLRAVLDALPLTQFEGAIGPDGLLMPGVYGVRIMIEKAFESVILGASDVATAQTTLQTSANTVVEQQNAEMRVLRKKLEQ